MIRRQTEKKASELLPKWTPPSRVPYPWAPCGVRTTLRNRGGFEIGPRSARSRGRWFCPRSGGRPIHRRSRPRRSLAKGQETSDIWLSRNLGGESRGVFVLVGETPRLRLARHSGRRPDQFWGDAGAALGGNALPGRRGAHVHRFRTTTAAGGFQRDALL